MERYKRGFPFPSGDESGEGIVLHRSRFVHPLIGNNAFRFTFTAIVGNLRTKFIQVGSGECRIYK